MNSTPYQKLYTTLYHRLLGLASSEPKYYQCVKALELGSRIHSGLRKDNITPEFYHQLNMLGYAMTFHNGLKEPDLVYTTILLHDAFEDKPSYVDKVYNNYPNLVDLLKNEFSEEFVLIKRMSKIDYTLDENGTFVPSKKDLSVYFEEIHSCIICSICKPIDRIHNLSSMNGVFSVEKKISYINDVHEYFLPLLKKARRIFIEQELIYLNLKTVLILQCDNSTFFLENYEPKKG